MTTPSAERAHKARERLRLLVATTNADKLREIRAVLAGMPVELLGLPDVPPVGDPEETGATFAENARLKARHYAAASGLLTVAEDSGLVIDALGGDPGVRSARFLRPDATYPERFAEISRRLSRVAGAPRTARFICALAVAREQDIVFETAGTIEGEVIDVPRGSRGFGYDPVFYYPPYGRTLAEMNEDEKLRAAHRGVAFRRLGEWLRGM